MNGVWLCFLAVSTIECNSRNASAPKSERKGGATWQSVAFRWTQKRQEPPSALALFLSPVKSSLPSFAHRYGLTYTMITEAFHFVRPVEMRQPAQLPIHLQTSIKTVGVCYYFFCLSYFHVFFFFSLANLARINDFGKTIHKQITSSADILHTPTPATLRPSGLATCAAASAPSPSPVPLALSCRRVRASTSAEASPRCKALP